MHASLAPIFLPALVAALPCCLLLGCGGTPDQVASCGPEQGTPSEKRAVALGEGQGNDFRPYSDGDTATLVTGGQGFSMITPVVRVAATPDDPSETCLLVELITEYGESGGSAGGGGAGGGPGSGGFGGGFEPGPGSLQQGAKFVLKDGYLFTDGALYNPIEGLSGLVLTLTVTGKAFDGTSTVTVNAGSF